VTNIDTNTTSTPAVANVTQQTLDATPARAMKFLYAIGTVPAIRAALAARGYTQKEHERGWSLLHAASGYSQQADFGIQADPAVLAAVNAIDAWDEDGFRIVQAALTRLHPEQAKTVLAGIGPSTGAASVVGVKLLLDRLDTLAKSKNHSDEAAMKTLAQRGITEAERKRLRSLVDVAEKGTSAAPPDRSAAERAAAERQQALIDLRAWYEDWSEMARAVIKRRDRLIRLGLAQRHSRRKPAPAPAPAPATATASGTASAAS
jgi:hypothetical protein